MEWSGMTQMPSEQPEEDEGERMATDASSESEEDEPSEMVEDVLVELDQLVGIGPVKDEIHRLTATFRVLARRRLEGLPVSPSSYHCVFSGSPERARRRSTGCAGVETSDAATPLFGDFPPSVRRENLLYYPPTSEPF